MDKVLIDIEIIKGIINSYSRADKNQTRIYGMILGTKKDNLYHVTEAIYGYIFEDKESSDKKSFTRLNDDSFNSLLNSLHQKLNFTQNIPGGPGASKVKAKEKQEKDIFFKRNDNLMILGGFCTDRELFGELIHLYSTIDSVPDNDFKNNNSLLLLVDPNYKDEKELKYGVKAFNWSTKTIKIKNSKPSSLLVFRELDCEIVQHIHNIEILKNIKNKYMWEKILSLNIDKNETKNINELLFDLTDKDEKILEAESNTEFIKNKMKECLIYLNVFEKFLENKDENNKENANIVYDDDYNQIAFILSQLGSMLDDNEIIDAINKDINKKYNLDSLSQLLDVQLALSDKIRKLIN